MGRSGGICENPALTEFSFRFLFFLCPRPPAGNNEHNNQFTFRTVKDTSFLVLKVKDQDKYTEDDDLGRLIIPLRYARLGYRHAFLESKKSTIQSSGSSCVLMRLEELK